MHVHNPDVARNVPLAEIMDLQAKFMSAIKWGRLITVCFFWPY